MSYLAYPQVILTFWAPLLILVLAAATRRWREGLAPEAGFWISLGLLLLPMLIWFIPYLPELPLREWLPYRAPIAWGVYNSPEEADWLEWRLLTFPAAAAFGSMVVSAFYGCAEQLLAGFRIRRLPQQRGAECTVLDVPGALAFTLGCWKPRIYLSREVWAGPHREAVLAHEQGHARARHPLWLALARWSSRSLWYWPAAQRLCREVQTWAELAADAEAVKVAGKPALAHALQNMLPSAPVSRPALSFATAGTLSRRAQSLVRPGKALPVWAVPTLVGLYIALLLLI